MSSCGFFCFFSSEKMLENKNKVSDLEIMIYMFVCICFLCNQKTD